MERKSAQIGDEIIELLKEAESIIASKEEEEKRREEEEREEKKREEEVVGEEAVDSTVEGTDVNIPNNAAHTDAPSLTDAVEADAVDAEAVDVEAVDTEAVDAEAVEAQMQSHVASLEAEASQMEANIMRLINTVSAMAKRVEEKKDVGKNGE